MIFDGGLVGEDDLAAWSLQPTEIKRVALVNLDTGRTWSPARPPAASVGGPRSALMRWPTPRTVARRDQLNGPIGPEWSDLAKFQSYVLESDDLHHSCRIIRPRHWERAPCRRPPLTPTPSTIRR